MSGIWGVWCEELNSVRLSLGLELDLDPSNYRTSGDSRFMNNYPGGIHQANSGFMSGGMQAAVGNNNTQVTANDASSSEMITQSEVAELILQIKQAIQALDIPDSAKENSIKCLDIAKLEAEEEEPDKEFVSKNLERVVKNITSLEKTLDSSQRIMTIISPLLIKIASWLGTAAGSFWTLLG